MTPEQRKEYNKTWYYKFVLRPGILPENWISGRPLKVFGYTFGYLFKCAKPNYKWNK